MLLLLSFQFLIISSAKNRGIYSRRLILSFSYTSRLSLPLTQVPSSRCSTILSRCLVVATTTANAIRFILDLLSYSLISSKVYRLHIGVRSLFLRVNNANLIRQIYSRKAGITSILNLIAAHFSTKRGKWEKISILNLANRAMLSTTTYFTAVV